MPRLMSPLRPRYMRRPPERTAPDMPESPAVLPTGVPAQTAQAPDARQQEQPAEPEYPETVQVSEGTFRQVRDDSLVLLSQGIEHRLVRSEEGPFHIFIVPEMESAAKTQLELYHKENPPKEENPPIPLSFSLQPLWVLLAPILVTLLQFTDKINLHSEGVSDAAKVLKGEWWRSLTAQTLHHIGIFDIFDHSSEKIAEPISDLPVKNCLINCYRYLHTSTSSSLAITMLLFVVVSSSSA